MHRMYAAYTGNGEGGEGGRGGGRGFSNVFLKLTFYLKLHVTYTSIFRKLNFERTGLLTFLGAC